MSSFHSFSESPRFIPKDERPVTTSFSEAFLDSVSCTRFGIQERYQEHFNELRNGILEFCKDFQIPNVALKDLKAFEDALTSHKPLIPLERIRQVLLLFQKLEHLVANKEPLKEKPPGYLQEAEHLYHLSEQYTSQVSLLEQVGILKEGKITGIDGREYPIPTLEQIAQCLFERESELSVKRDQGFTKLLLVPFGMSLDALREILKQFLLSYKQAHPAFDLDTDDPLYAWKDGYEGADIGDPPKMVYYPKSFDPDHHKGQTKTQILEEQDVTPGSFPGWTVHLFQPPDPTNQESKGFASVPREGQGTTHGEETPRPSLEAGKSPNEYLSTLQEAQEDPNSPYHNESGLTPEDWILAFITHLEETGQPLDNYQNSEESITYLTGSFFPSIVDSAFVPCVYWIRDNRRAYLRRDDPRGRDGFVGVRSSVIV